MEYAAVFLLFIALTAAALRLAATGRGAGKLAFLVVLAALICSEPVGKSVKISLPSLFLAAAGAVYTGYKRDVAALFCAFATAVLTVSSLSYSMAATYSEITVYYTAILLCALVNNPEGAGGVLALGMITGHTYCVLKDHTVALRAELFSLNITYAAIVCTVAAAFFKALLSFAERGENTDSAPRNLRLKPDSLAKRV